MRERGALWQRYFMMLSMSCLNIHIVHRVLLSIARMPRVVNPPTS